MLCKCGCGCKTEHGYMYVKGHREQINKLQETTVKRFWKKVLVSSDDNCWNWIGAKLDGYGRLCINKKYVLAHRFSYELSFGKIPNGLLICHRCNNKSCVNPNHLYAGTYKDNNDDAWRAGSFKNRRASGWGRRFGAKLNENDVREIRRSYIYRIVKISDLAQRFNISKTAIQSIIKMKSWKDII